MRGVYKHQYHRIRFNFNLVGRDFLVGIPGSYGGNEGALERTYSVLTLPNSGNVAELDETAEVKIPHYLH